MDTTFATNHPNIMLLNINFFFLVFQMLNYSTKDNKMTAKAFWQAYTIFNFLSVLMMIAESIRIMRKILIDFLCSQCIFTIM